MQVYSAGRTPSIEYYECSLLVISTTIPFLHENVSERKIPESAENFPSDPGTFYLICQFLITDPMRLNISGTFFPVLFVFRIIPFEIIDL